MDYFRSKEELAQGLTTIQDSPRDEGTLEMIVIRPADRERQVLEECQVSARLGVHGDFWAKTCWSKQPDGSPNPDVQVTLMNSRCIALVAQTRERWPLAGDQLYVDLDLTSENLPVGQRLAIGTAIFEITAVPHTGCALFSERFGVEASRFIKSEAGKKLHLRGIYARVVQDGLIKTGDTIRKID